MKLKTLFGLISALMFISPVFGEDKASTPEPVSRYSVVNFSVSVGMESAAGGAQFGNNLFAFLQAHPTYKIISITPISDCMMQGYAGTTTAIVVVFEKLEPSGK